MGGKAHVIHVGGGFSPFRHGDGTRPEPEVVHSVGAFSNSKEGLAVCSLNTGDNNIFSLPLDSAGVKHGVHAYAFHQERIGFTVKVITPFQRGVRGRQDGVLIAFKYAISLHGDILLFKQLLLILSQPLQPLVKVHSTD